jgi:hypothetical protein
VLRKLPSDTPSDTFTGAHLRFLAVFFFRFHPHACGLSPWSPCELVSWKTFMCCGCAGLITLCTGGGGRVSAN